MLNKIFATFAFFAAAFGGHLFGQDYDELFKDRSKCAVTVQYIVEREEFRERYGTTGLVVNDEGLILLPISEIPEYMRLSSLKEFKVFVFEGDEDGYPAEYLGADNSSGAHFIRLKGKMPDLMQSYAKFPRGKITLGENLWGVGISQYNMSYEPFLMRSYVTDIAKRPRLMAGFGSSITTVGGPVFNSAGEFVGWGQSERREGFIADFGRNGRAQVTLISQTSTAGMLLPEELDDILASMPQDPNGDARGWLGAVELNILKRDVATLMGLEKKTAFILGDVIKTTGADNAGLKKGDIIVGINGKDIERLRSDRESLSNFWFMLSKMKPNDKISLAIVRGSEEPKEVEVVLGEAPKTFRKSDFEYFKRLGFSVREYLVDDAVARRKLDGTDWNGGIVQFVKPNSPASSAMPTPLAQNDLIKEINSVPVNTYAEVVAALSKIESDTSVKELVILAEDLKETKVVRIKLD